jgi:predicted DNA-binding transcriptional regulator AlpA
MTDSAKDEKGDLAAFLSPSDLEKRWRVSKSLVYKIIHSEEFPPPLRLGVSGGAGKSLRFSREDIEAWERKNMKK